MKQDNDSEQEYFAVVLWRDGNKKIHIVGTLAYFDGKYYFKYEQSSLKKARENNFSDIGSFNDDEKLYISENSLFNFFKKKVPENIQNTPQALKELIRTGGIKTNDDTLVIGINSVYKAALKAEFKRREQAQRAKDTQDSNADREI